jgi:hypothetical protein
VRRYQNEIDIWLQDHHEELEQIVNNTRLDADTIELVVFLVLTGRSDEAIYAELGAEHVSPNGQRNPFERAPEAIEAIRRLAAAA